jgi:hypothetical protein
MAVAGIGAEPVDGFGREGDELARAQTCHCLRDSGGGGGKDPRGHDTMRDRGPAMPESGREGRAVLLEFKLLRGAGARRRQSERRPGAPAQYSCLEERQ